MTEFKNGDIVTCVGLDDDQRNGWDHGQGLYVGPHPNGPEEWSVIFTASNPLFMSVRTADLSLVPKTYEITVTLTEEEMRNRIGMVTGSSAGRKLNAACREALKADEASHGVRMPQPDD